MLNLPQPAQHLLLSQADRLSKWTASLNDRLSCYYILIKTREKQPWQGKSHPQFKKKILLPYMITDIHIEMLVMWCAVCILLTGWGATVSKGNLNDNLLLSQVASSYRPASPTVRSHSLLQPVRMSFMVPPSTIALTWSLSQPGTGMIQVLGEIRRQFIAETTEVIIQASIKIYQQCHSLSPFRQDLVKIG